MKVILVLMNKQSYFFSTNCQKSQINDSSMLNFELSSFIIQVDFLYSNTENHIIMGKVQHKKDNNTGKARRNAVA